jgi:hypothetical protein
MSIALATGTILRSGSQPVLVPTGPAGPDHQLALRLHGMDLPPAGTRAVMEGKLTGRSLHVSEWRPEPDSTSAWGDIPDVEGVSPAVTHRITDSIPESWPIISIGETKTSGNNRVVVLEVDQATPEVQEWFHQQPHGSVHLITFIRPKPRS